MNKTFTFHGVDFKTELRLGVLLAIPTLLIWLSIIVFFHYFFPDIYFLFVLITGSGVAVYLATLLLSVFMKYVKDTVWDISIDKEAVKITFRRFTWDFKLQDIRIIKNLGSIGFRYLTIITRNETIKIRVGDSGLTPFSEEKDMKELDAFVEFLKPYLDQGFNKKVLKNKLYPNIFPNYGVYVVKSEKIKYRMTEKMTPKQFIIFGLAIGLLFCFLMITCIFYFIDNK